MNDGFIRVASATPEIRVGDCTTNKNNIIAQIKEAAENNASVVLFPELCITGYTCGDLFLQKLLLDNAVKAVADIAEAVKCLDIIAVVGTPVACSGVLYNCGAVLYKGDILALVPKMNIPAYSEFYEMRHFQRGKDTTININGKIVPILTNAVFECENIPDFKFGIEVCEDLWVGSSPSVKLAENGALMIFNLSASDEVIGKPEYRQKLIEIQSAKLIAAYIYADAGMGESTTDMVFSGNNIIAENGTVLAEAQRFTTGVIYADVDLHRLQGERRRSNTFTSSYNADYVKFAMEKKNIILNRKFRKTPFVPSVKSDVDKRCKEIISIQSAGLATRLKHTGIKTAVIGLSGGLDSTLALIVTVHAFDMLSLDRKNITAVTMPCFGTTKRTKSNAEKLAEAYGVSFRDIDISKVVEIHFADINHDPNTMNVTYENSQARERTQVLMDIANQVNGLVIGTGDLSELALGWATYNGDHMSMYAVNASVPKTLVRYITAYEAQKSEGTLNKVLNDILATPVSPELLPPKDGVISQKTEELVGPYELHDFFLYYFVRFNYPPAKIYRIAKIAFKDDYEDSVIKKWLTVFVKRFFSQQFKRSCLPDGPKVGTVTLSPRSDFRMPSDASVNMWLKDLENIE